MQSQEKIQQRPHGEPKYDGLKIQLSIPTDNKYVFMYIWGFHALKKLQWKSLINTLIPPRKSTPTDPPWQTTPP